LNNRWVLSAAHCHDFGVNITRVRVGVTKVDGGEEDTFRIRGSRKQFKVGMTKEVEIARIVVHPDYRQDRFGVTHNDLVLLELKTPVEFGPLVQPVCLPEGRYEVADDSGFARVMGWGLALKDDRSPTHLSSQNHLQWVELDILSEEECQEAYTSIDPRIKLDPLIHMCAGRQVGQDSCNGDSGGPLVVQKGRYSVLVGVVSGGPACAQGWAGYYARVSNFMGWINTYVK